MNTGEWLTRGTIWLALSLYAAAEMVGTVRLDRCGFTAARWLNGLGATAFLAHVASAFHFHYHWSHPTAYADTARQTAEFSGWNWGGGLYINYLFLLVWLGEVAWSWVWPMKYVQRRNWIRRAVRGFFLFMIFNGAVVFVRGPGRWYGLMMCLILGICWWRTGKQHPGKTRSESV